MNYFFLIMSHAPQIPRHLLGMLASQEGVWGSGAYGEASFFYSSTAPSISSSTGTSAGSINFCPAIM